MRHTKIIATLGPASSSDAVIRDLLAAGVDVFRLNFSHGTHATHGETIARIRRAAEEAGRAVAILQDLSGPKIRTGPLEGGRPIRLAPGDELRIAVGDFPGRPGRVSITYAELMTVVRPGDTLLLDDGHLQVRVEANDSRELRTTVVDGGMLGEHKGINAPGVALPSSGLTAKDEQDLRFGVGAGVDLVAMSFVQSAADLRQVKDALAEAGAPTLPVVAKLERPEAVARLDEILQTCDAIMLAGETAVGAHPVRAVQTLDLVIGDAESIPPRDSARLEHSRLLPEHGGAICEAALTLVDRSHAAAIVAITRGGKTARVLSALRPRVPVFAATDRPEIARRLALWWGIAPVLADLSGDVSIAARRIIADLVSSGVVASSATLVLVSVTPDLAPDASNFLKVQRA